MLSQEAGLPGPCMWNPSISPVLASEGFSLVYPGQNGLSALGQAVQGADHLLFTGPQLGPHVGIKKDGDAGRPGGIHQIVAAARAASIR